MTWLAVDESGIEAMFHECPFRDDPVELREVKR